MNNPLALFAEKRVLITGASGFIGTWLSKSLSITGAEVYRTIRRMENDPDCNAEQRTFVVDLTNKSLLRDVLGEVRPDIVFNSAAYGIDHSEHDPALYREINVDLPARLCELLASSVGTPVRLVHIGSGAEYGSSLNEITEETMERPISLYGVTKLAGTRKIVEASLRGEVHGLVARLFTVYGPGEHRGRLLPSLLEGARLKRVISLTKGDQKRDFTYIEDCVEGLLRLASAPVSPGAIINIATGLLTTIRTFSETAADLLGLDRELLQFGVLPTTTTENLQPPVSTKLIHELTQWRPETNVREGILRTAINMGIRLNNIEVRL